MVAAARCRAVISDRIAATPVAAATTIQIIALWTWSPLKSSLISLVAMLPAAKPMAEPRIATSAPSNRVPRTTNGTKVRTVSVATTAVTARAPL